MCVLAGCDFLPSVPGIGIAKAYALVSKYRNLDRVSAPYLLLNKVDRKQHNLVVSSVYVGCFFTDTNGAAFNWVYYPKRLLAFCWLPLWGSLHERWCFIKKVFLICHLFCQLEYFFIFNLFLKKQVKFTFVNPLMVYCSVELLLEQHQGGLLKCFSYDCPKHPRGFKLNFHEGLVELGFPLLWDLEAHIIVKDSVWSAGFKLQQTRARRMKES